MSDETPLTPEQLSRLREAINQVPYAQLLGIEFEEATRGAATLSMSARPELQRFGGIMHGGALASLADSASAFAVLSTLADDEQTVTVDLTLHYLRPVTGGKLTARARVLRGGRRVATVSVEIFNESGALVVTALTTYIKLR
ncbi:MAG TPA: PaaI family thioesterase [Pyrinomonadaceae bacterium]|nr:PaaI family thioesterase [Pyrinomonadaceae bacterium]